MSTETPEQLNLEQKLLNWAAAYGVIALSSASASIKSLEELIELEKLSLINLVDERVIGLNELEVSPDGSRQYQGRASRNSLRQKQRTRLAKLKELLSVRKAGDDE